MPGGILFVGNVDRGGGSRFRARTARTRVKRQLEIFAPDLKRQRSRRRLCRAFRSSRRLRFEVRTSDWIAWAVALLRHRVPQDWRGTAREREIRALVINVVEQATGSDPAGYDRWFEALQRLLDVSFPLTETPESGA